MTASATPFTCAQCLYSDASGTSPRFCPRCGLAVEGEKDNDPITLRVPGGEITIHDRLAYGDLCNLYRCELAGQMSRGIFKIARSHRANTHVAREAETLQRLIAADRDKKFAPFLPRPAGSIRYSQDDGQPVRLANVLTYSDGINGPDELYSLEQVRAAYPSGLDARDMAWIWRRLLTILGFVHDQRVAHSAVTPDHILIEPREHKLVLIGWSAAAPIGAIPHLGPLRWRHWNQTGNKPPTATAAFDLGCAAHSMSYLLPEKTEPAISRHLQRAGETSDAWKLLSDFDALIEALWGPRQFRPLEMPSSSR